MEAASPLDPGLVADKPLFGPRKEIAKYLKKHPLLKGTEKQLDNWKEKGCDRDAILAYAYLLAKPPVKLRPSNLPDCISALKQVSRLWKIVLQCDIKPGMCLPDESTQTLGAFAGAVDQYRRVLEAMIPFERYRQNRIAEILCEGLFDHIHKNTKSLPWRAVSKLMRDLDLGGFRDADALRKLYRRAKARREGS